MHRFHLCNDVLYMDDTCLYRSPRECSDDEPRRTLECIGSLARFAQLTMVDENGLCNSVGTPASCPLDAVCSLVHGGRSVALEEWTAEDTSTEVNGSIRIPVRRPFELRTLLTPPRVTDISGLQPDRQTLCLRRARLFIRRHTTRREWAP